MHLEGLERQEPILDLPSRRAVGLLSGAAARRSRALLQLDVRVDRQYRWSVTVASYYYIHKTIMCTFYIEYISTHNFILFLPIANFNGTYYKIREYSSLVRETFILLYNF